MKKNYLRQISCLGRMVLKWWLCLLLGGMLNLPATAQQKTAPRVNLKVEKTSLIRAIEALRSQTRYNFLFNSKDLQPYTDISVHLQSVTLQQALDSLLIGRKTGLEYTIEGETVVIRKKQTQEQQCTVNGRVTDNRGQALPGVTVLVKGTTMGTVTDVDGNYKISLPKIGLTLRFSFLGMGTQEIVVTGPECNVILEEEQNSLEEAVVVGYGVVKKKDLTGSVSSVDTRLIEESAAADIGTIIQGQVSGLHILTGSGAPGEEVQIQIRGCASLSGNTSPLIVVDEVPMPSDFSINQLNPSDIKSIDVLKGGSSSAIYGSRASAGVILITMKKGSRNEKPLISYDYTFGTRQLVSDINVLNTEEFKLLLLEATRNSAQEQGYTNLSDYRYYKDYTTPGYFGEVNTPWMKLLMQPARVHKHNISVRGGGHSSNYSVSYGLIDEEGMLVNTSNRRHNLNLNLDTDLNKWLKMGVTFRGDLSKRGQTENFNVAAEARPDLPCYNEDGSYYVHKYMYQGEERFESNPMIEAKERDNVNQDLGANITSYLVSRPFGGLSLRLQYSYNYKQSKGRDFYPSMTLYGSGGYKGQKGQLTNTERLSENQELMGQIMYGKRIKKHNFDITMVGTLTDSKNSYASMTFADFPDDKTQTSIWQGVTYKDQMGYDKGALLLSYVARANYSFNDRYLLTVSWRADGSSRFSPDNRWSYFPSLAVAYNLTEEKFLRHNKVINFLKLRASVGKVGMGYVDEYGWRTLYDATEYLDQPAIVPGSMGNNNLKWEGNSSDETLFANKHNLKSDWTYTWFSNTCAQFYSPSADNYSNKDSYPFGTGWGAGPVSPAMVNEWKDWAAKQTYTDGYKEDPRLTGSIWSYKALDPNVAGNVLMDCTMDEGEPEYTVSYRYYEQTGYFQKKYININSYNEGKIEPFGKQMFPGISSQTSQQLLQIADLIHIRFADVLLMQSELKQDATGLNKVRARSHLAPVAYSLEAIKQERRWELAFESIRWWDILRWSGPSLEEAGDILNKQTGFNIINAATVVPMVKFDYKKRLQATQGYWPIPQDEIDISNGVLEQNPGWDASAQFSDWNNM